MHGEIHIDETGMELLRAAVSDEKYRQASELERKMIEKVLTFFAESNGRTLSGLLTFRAKCEESEKMNREYKTFPDSVFGEIRAWQIEKDALLLAGTRRRVPELEFEEISKEGERLLGILEKGIEEKIK